MTTGAPGAAPVARPHRRLPVGPGLSVLLVAAALFIGLWMGVLVGSRTLIGGDILYGCCLPWGAAAGAHPPSNTTVGDPVNQFLPWRMIEGRALAAHQLPLWNPYALQGVPLLGTGVSATLSPFTLAFLPFDPARAMSLAMLAKLWVAGLGTVAFLRLLGARPAAAAVAGVAYGTSGFLVVWLAWPQSSVAAIMPWAFAAVEWYLTRRTTAAVAGIALAVGAQFLAGHAETSIHFGMALGVYVVIRTLVAGAGGIVPLAIISGAGLLGAALAAIQLVPFLDELSRSTLVASRGQAMPGLEHLPLSAAASWLIPNAHGNPGIDGLIGRPPNYNETTAFAGVGSLLLSPLALAWSGAGRRSAVAGLAVIGALSFGSAYGPVTPLIGRLPLLGLLPSGRFWVVACFVVATLGGLGLDVLLARGGEAVRPLTAGLCVLGAAGLVGLVAAGVELVRVWAGVDRLLPSVHGSFGFWVVVAVLSVAVAAAFGAAGVLRTRGGLVAGGFAALALAEGALFAAPFNPRVPPSEVPPHSDAIAWLQANAGGTYLAATGSIFVSETPTLYELYDARGYEIAGLTPRVRDYWLLADPSYSDETYRTQFTHPDAIWLAASGVGFVMTPTDTLVAGTTPVYRGEGVVIAAVPNVRPFAFVPARIVEVRGEPQARAYLADHDPLEAVAIERCCGAGELTEQPGAEVSVLSRGLDSVSLQVSTPKAATVVVLQSYWPGWTATVDGRPAAIAPANLHFQSVLVPAGTHRVELRYQPRSVPIGAAASAVGLVICALLLAAGSRPWRLTV